MGALGIGTGGEMAEIRVATETGRNMRGARHLSAGTGMDLVRVTPGGLEKESGGEMSPGRVKVLAPVKKTWRGNGLERLEKAADRRLGQASEALADLLLEKAKVGKVESARLLMTLAEHRMKRKPPEKKKKKRRGPSWADLLASEPEWKEPEVGDVWAGGGWRKQGTGEFVRECEPVENGYEQIGVEIPGVTKGLLTTGRKD
jgi:hypothetical protein